MEKLDMSRTSAYRRLKGLIPFNYEEIAILADQMNFSIDELIHKDSRRKYIFEFEDFFNYNIEEIIYYSLYEYYKQLCTNLKMKEVRTLEITNNLWFVYTLFSDNLFKFYFYKYHQQYDISSLKKRMKDMEIPLNIVDMKKKITEVIINNHNVNNNITTSILDRHIFFNTMNDIQYYYRRGLISDIELKLIAKDIDDLLNNIEKGTIEDRGYGRDYQYFIGQRNMYSNSSSVTIDNKLYSLFYEHNLHPIICNDRRLCELHYAYLQSHKRQSILISSSNEKLQIGFFEKQHQYSKKLAENIDLEPDLDYF